MGLLTEQSYLNASRDKAETLLRQHFRLKQPGETALPSLADSGVVLDVDDQGEFTMQFNVAADD